MRKNRTRQRKTKSKKGGGISRKSTAGKAPRKSLTPRAAIKTLNENGNNGHNEDNRGNENSSKNEKNLRIEELEKKLSAIHDMSRN
jgi:hypothetical protein